MKLRNVSLFTVLSLSMLLAGCTSKEEEDSSIDSGGVAEDIDGVEAAV